MVLLKYYRAQAPSHKEQNHQTDQYIFYGAGYEIVETEKSIGMNITLAAAEKCMKDG
jgi:hypothetical protein